MQYEPDYSDGFRRLVAVILDLSLITTILFRITFSFADWTQDDEGGLIWVSILIVATVYFVLLEWRFGRTVGKFLVNVRVVTETRSRITFRESLVRNVFKLPELLLAQLFFMMLLIALAFRSGSVYGPWLVFGPAPRQRWGDQLAGTYVIRGPWKPVLVNSTRPASSNRDSAFTPDRYPADGSPGIRLSGRKPEK